MSSIYDWSTDPDDNGSSDSGINLAEGMPPSAVNNSNRQMMGRNAEYVKDIGGALAAGGTANAITLTANSAITAYANGQRFTFRATADNTGATTVNINSIGSKSIRKVIHGGDAALTGGEIQSGAAYEIIYSSGLDSGAGGWQLMNLPVAGYTNSSSPTLADYPIGQPLVAEDKLAVSLSFDINGTVPSDLKVVSSDRFEFNTASTGTSLLGTWRFKSGAITANKYLIQRVE